MNKYKKIELKHSVQSSYEYKIISLSGNEYTLKTTSSINDILDSYDIYISDGFVLATTAVETIEEVRITHQRRKVLIFKDTPYYPERTWFGKWKAYESE